jgi:hypothetical protein
VQWIDPWKCVGDSSTHFSSTMVYFAHINSRDCSTHLFSIILSIMCSPWFRGFIHFFLVVLSIELNLGGLWFDDLIHSFYFHGLVQYGYFFMYGGFHLVVHEWLHLGGNVVGSFVWFRHDHTNCAMVFVCSNLGGLGFQFGIFGPCWKSISYFLTWLVPLTQVWACFKIKECMKIVL